MIQQWKLWEQSTGPRTAEGKAKASQDAYKGGTGLLVKQLGQVLREQQRLIDNSSK